MKKSGTIMNDPATKLRREIKAKSFHNSSKTAFLSDLTPQFKVRCNKSIYEKHFIS